MSKVWFITGAGRGMGVDIAKAALAARHKVVATGRNTDKVAEALGKSAGRFREAQEQVTRALALDPNSPFGLYIQGHLFEHNHRLEAAVMQFRKAVNSSGRTPKYLFTLADAYSQAGRKGNARKILAELQQQSKTQYVSPDYLRRLSDELGK